MRTRFALFGLLTGALVSASCGGSEKNESSNPLTDDAGTDAGGNAGDASASGGDGGSGGSTGGTGGSTGGIGGSTGGIGGSTGGIGGAGGTGGSTGGAGGSPDAGDDSAIATLNAPCSQAGELACAGHAQKLQLLCDGTKWDSNGVCPGTQFCDTRPGPFAGSCQEAVPECLEKQPGEATCNGATLTVCGPDLVTATTEQCGSADLCLLNDGEHCVGCADGQYRCIGAELETCGADHLSWDHVMTCPDAASCDAVDGKCANHLCAPNQHRCTGDLLEKCDAAGDSWIPVQTCAAGLCDAVGEQCDACQPNTATCYNATTRLVCAGDGQSLNAVPCTPPTGGCTNGVCVACTPTNLDFAAPLLDMYLMVDRSGSMDGTPWLNQRGALTGFFQDTASTDLGVAMRYFPLDDACAAQDYSCTGGAYTTPLVAWGTLPGHATALEASLVGTQAQGCFTPTQEALNGVLAGAKERQLAEPSHVVIAVMLSDGAPCCGDCPVEQAAGLGTVAASYYTGNPSIRTFTVAVSSAATAVMSTIAQEGGGQSYASGSGTADIQSALNAVREAAAQCVFNLPLPDGGTLNASTIGVGYLPPGASTPVPITQVAGPSACVGDGYYFDSSLSPTQVLLCPSSCAALRANSGAQIRVSVDGCN